MATALHAPTPQDLGAPALPPYLHAYGDRVMRPQLGWLRPTTLDTPLDEMRKRLEEDEYLFVKGLLPRDEVLAMREHYFSHYLGSKLLQEGLPLVDGIYNSSEDAANHRGIGGALGPEGDDLQRLIKAHVAPHYLEFLKNKKLRTMVRDLMGWDSEILLRRTMLRHNVPGPNSAGTGCHYDKLFLRGGSAFFLTAWVPIGDIRPTGGGLIYLENSAALGQAIEDDFMERAKDFTEAQRISAFNANMTEIGILSPDPKTFQRDHHHIAEKAGQADRSYKWLIANYEAGDVVFHHPCSIHASCANEDPDGRIRLSTDLRFYSQKDFEEGTADTRWTELWNPGDRL